MMGVRIMKKMILTVVVIMLVCPACSMVSLHTRLSTSSDCRRKKSLLALEFKTNS